MQSSRRRQNVGEPSRFARLEELQSGDASPTLAKLTPIGRAPAGSAAGRPMVYTRCSASDRMRGASLQNSSGV